jgi:serine/threonine protein kinase
LQVVVAGEDPTVMKRLCREIHILSRVKHPNVVRLLDVHYEETGTTRSASLLFEACRGGELFDFVNVRPALAPLPLTTRCRRGPRLPPRKERDSYEQRLREETAPPRCASGMPAS